MIFDALVSGIGLIPCLNDIIWCMLRRYVVVLKKTHSRIWHPGVFHDLTLAFKSKTDYWLCSEKTPRETAAFFPAGNLLKHKTRHAAANQRRLHATLAEWDIYVLDVPPLSDTGNEGVYKGTLPSRSDSGRFSDNWNEGNFFSIINTKQCAYLSVENLSNFF